MVMRIMAIAWTTCLDAARQRVVYVLLGAGLVLVLVVGQLPMFTFSVLDDVKMAKDMAVSTAGMVGLLLAIFAATHTVTEEIESGTVVTLLSKPVERWEFVVGKFLGLALLVAGALVVLLAGMVPAVWAGMYSRFADYGGIYPEYVQNFWLRFAWPAAGEVAAGVVASFLGVVVLTALAVAACVRLPAIPAAAVYFGVFLLGHLVEGLVQLTRGAGAGWRLAGATLEVVAPHLGVFQVTRESGGGWGAGAMLSSAAYAVCYASALVICATLLFRRREVF